MLPLKSKISSLTGFPGAAGESHQTELGRSLPPDQNRFLDTNSSWAGRQQQQQQLQTSSQTQLSLQRQLSEPPRWVLLAKAEKMSHTYCVRIQIIVNSDPDHSEFGSEPSTGTHPEEIPNLKVLTSGLNLLLESWQNWFWRRSMIFS
jgi:hypothetical protein